MKWSRICIYLRKSRKDKDKPDESEEETLRRHETTLLAYAKEHKLHIVAVKKEVKSGESLAKRPYMIEMLEEIEEGKYDAVLVMDIDRLTRGEMLDQGIIISTFKRNNVQIITLEKTYNLDDDLDEEMVDFNAFFARKEFKTINKRLSRGRLKSLEEGNYIGGYPPYGYTYDKGKKCLFVNEKEAENVKLIYDMYINQEMGDTKITYFMRDNNIKTNLGKTWNATMTRRILTNPLYIGKVTWSKSTNNPKIFKGNHEPIISEDIFNKAQIIAKERYNPRIKEGLEIRNPLMQLIVCSNCNIKMGMRVNKNEKDGIRCKYPCGNKSSYIENVEKRLVDITYQYLLDIKLGFNYKTKKKKGINIIEKTIENINKDLNKNYEQKNKLFDLLEQGIYDNKTFLERMNVLTVKINDLESNLEKVQNKLSEEKVEKKIDIPMVLDAIDFIENIYYKSSAKIRNKFLREIVDYAVYTKTEKGLDTFKLEVIFKL
jgi:DNA invertase Pin-like site-specific DNA recombinase